MRVVFVTNMPAPYRIKTLNLVADEWKSDFLVIFCSRREPNRNWDFPDMRFNHLYLKENVHRKKDGTTFIHNNPDIWKKLKSYDPDVIITGGFNPTMLYAFLYCMVKRKKHIPLSDSWALLEEKLSFVHKLIRKLVYRYSKAFIACSIKGKSYFQSFGIKPEAIHISPLTIDLSRFSNHRGLKDRPYDLMFSGRFVESKNPVFFIKVANLVQQQLKRPVSILLLGEGPLHDSLMSAIKALNLDMSYPGFVSQEKLPEYYASSRLLLFPTAFDAWGVVASEALASGTPVIISPFAGCSGELALHEQNGYVLPLEEDLWANHCVELLQDENKWISFSVNARRIVSLFTHEKAAEGLKAACYHAFNNKRK